MGLRRSINSEYKQFIGTSHSGKTSNTCCLDGIGNPVYIQIIGRNIHDFIVAVDALSHIDISNSIILEDKAYGTKEILDYIQQQSGDYAIPAKSNATNS